MRMRMGSTDNAPWSHGEWSRDCSKEFSIQPLQPSEDVSTVRPCAYGTSSNITKLLLGAWLDSVCMILILCMDELARVCLSLLRTCVTRRYSKPHLRLAGLAHRPIPWAYPRATDLGCVRGPATLQQRLCQLVEIEPSIATRESARVTERSSRRRMEDADLTRRRPAKLVRKLEIDPELVDAGKQGAKCRRGRQCRAAPKRLWR